MRVDVTSSRIAEANTTTASDVEQNTVHVNTYTFICGQIRAVTSSATPSDVTVKRRTCGSVEVKSEDPARWYDSARPHTLFQSKKYALGLFLLIDFLIYYDRGIVPGAHQEFSLFLMTAPAIRNNPEFYFGFLQSVFIGGLALAAPILSYLSTKSEHPLFYCSVGLCLWLFSMGGLFVCRALSGAGEGAFIGLMAPILLDANSAKSRGLFLGLFYGLMPLGVAAGFVTSATFASLMPWGYTFLSLFAMSAIPIGVVCTYGMTDESRGLSPFAHWATEVGLTGTPCITTRSRFGSQAHAPEHSLSHQTVFSQRPKMEPVDTPTLLRSLQATPLPNHAPTLGFTKCFSALCASPLFVSLLVVGAAQSAVAASLSSFGSAFLLNLGVVKHEVTASAAIGGVGAVAGALGVFAGGWLLRYPVARAGGALTHVRFVENDEDRYVSKLMRRLRWEGEPKIELVKRLITVRYITFAAMLLSVVAAQLLTLVAAMTGYLSSATFPLICLCVGLIAIFITQPGLNLAVMLTAPEELRSLSISIFTLGLHLLGDVPGPIIVGYLKDVLAPGCRPGGDMDECTSERGGVLWTLTVFLSWSQFVWLGLFCAYKFSRQGLRDAHTKIVIPSTGSSTAVIAEILATK